MSEERWIPDEQLVPAVLAGSCTRRMHDLCDADRAWAVAGMGAMGCTAEEIASRLGCSLRLVRTIRAWPMTQVCTYALTETRNFTDELRLRDSALAGLRGRVEAVLSENLALRSQRDNLIAAAAVHARLCGKCGEPLAGYNLYVCRGKKYCRACGRRRAAEARARRRDQQRAQQRRAAQTATSLDAAQQTMCHVVGQM
jgi:hypothetical protein